MIQETGIIKMRQHVWTLAVLACLVAFCSIAESRSLVKREANGGHDVYAHGHGYADKKKVEAAFGIKNAILGFVFNKPKPSTGFVWDQTTTTTPKAPTTTEDIVIFEKDQKVSLDVPGELFASSYTLVTNLSNTVGEFMINSALRAQRLLESMRPFLRKVFGAKGIVIEATTDKPIFSDPNAS
ncbi:uncharacterized protein LOC664268 isoform X2 [Tribolium castaneum]|nr:PREDICTED: uncharacterized protein LOC664268 isoform X2 [Tribolium castaneum]|eukprot:XP_015835012.1 PREDICTED: uncharacterized protein LOC664268 isoform X2 [Tribolium castaneum]